MCPSSILIQEKQIPTVRQNGIRAILRPYLYDTFLLSKITVDFRRAGSNTIMLILTGKEDRQRRRIDKNGGLIRMTDR